MRTLLLFSFTLLAAFSCSGGTVNAPAGSTVIDVASSLDNKITDLSQFVDTSYFVPLRTPAENLQGQIIRAALYNNKIFTFDEYKTRTVNAYNTDGKFLFSLYKIGRGPKEMLTAHSFTVSNNKVFVTGALENKTLVFSAEDGSYIRTINYPFSAIVCSEITDNRYLFELNDYNTKLGGEYLTNSVLITDSLFNVVAFGAKHPDASNLNEISRSTNESGDTFFSLYTDNVYKYNPLNDSLDVLYTFDYGDDNIPNDMRDDLLKFMEYYTDDNLHISSSPIIMGNSFIAQAAMGDKKPLIIYNDGKCYSYDITKDTYKFTDPLDIVGKGIGKGLENTVISSVYIGDRAEELKDYGVNYTDDITDILLITKFK